MVDGAAPLLNVPPSVIHTDLWILYTESSEEAEPIQTLKNDQVLWEKSRFHPFFMLFFKL